MIFDDTFENSSELDYRSSDGIEVSLRWRRSDDQVFVRVADAKSGERFEIPVDGEHALDAFRHPFAYAAWQGVEHDVSLEEILA
jgi:hypothetical protein